MSNAHCNGPAAKRVVRFWILDPRRSSGLGGRQKIKKNGGGNGTGNHSLWYFTILRGKRTARNVNARATPLQCKKKPGNDCAADKSRHGNAF